MLRRSLERALADLPLAEVLDGAESVACRAGA